LDHDVNTGRGGLIFSQFRWISAKRRTSINQQSTKSKSTNHKRPMKNRVVPASQFYRSSRKAGALPAVAVAASLFVASSADAHHLMDGRTPTNGFDALVSGFAHPVIGLDHLAFIITIGLLSAVVRPGLLLAVAFVLAAMAGTATHLVGLAIPGVESIISASVLLFGILLAVKRAPSDWIVVSFAAVAGIFHGYAYGEGIFGAETEALVAYLVGFTCVQMAVAAAAYAIGRIVLGRQNEAEPAGAGLRPAGLVICGIGFTLLSVQMLDALVAVVTKG
jgi:urease accessory protein